MSQQLEIEFKAMLRKAEYLKICNYYALKGSDFHTQTNVYFDHPNHLLKEKKWALRIRLLEDHGELTLKTPSSAGRIETTDKLSLLQTQELITNRHILTNGFVAEKLRQAAIDPASLIPTAKLTTKRAEFLIDQGLLAIDENWYGTQHDFELELEVTDPQKGRSDFLKLLTHWQIPYRPSQNKIARASKVFDETKPQA